MTTTKTAKTAQEFIDAQALGTYQQDYKNGELWEYAGAMWYLSLLELCPEELGALHCALNLDD